MLTVIHLLLLIVAAVGALVNVHHLGAKIGKAYPLWFAEQMHQYRHQPLGRGLAELDAVRLAAAGQFGELFNRRATSAVCVLGFAFYACAAAIISALVVGVAGISQIVGN